MAAKDGLHGMSSLAHKLLDSFACLLSHKEHMPWLVLCKTIGDEDAYDRRNHT